MSDIKVFNVTRIGASHIKVGKPCQDFSLSWQNDDNSIQVAIVCDGHGGDTYVRSDKGSKLAAQIAREYITEFVEEVPATLFLGKEAAVTARPAEEYDELFFGPRKMADISKMNEEELKAYKQEEEFRKAVVDIPKQDATFNRLFAGIYLEWLKEIEKDAKENPFTPEEKALLKQAKLVKAYGTTLMAFVQTPLYWFAFHIGDGKMLMCDNMLNWTEPVPWDYKCFLNVTTSLCGSNPLPDFRYAFNGKGSFPTAVIMGSDGLDDSWCTMPKLQNFYSQTLSIFNRLGLEQTVKELGDYLPDLSHKGSRDDMSMAGIINFKSLPNGIKAYEIRKKQQELLNETEKRETKLGELKEKGKSIETQKLTILSKLKELKENLLKLMESFKQEESKRNKEIEDQNASLRNLQDNYDKAKKDYEAAAKELEEWKRSTNKQMDELKEQIQQLSKAANSDRESELKTWETLKTDYEADPRNNPS